MAPLTETVVLQPLISPIDHGGDGLHRQHIARRSFARIHDAIAMPRLIETQLGSFEWFKQEGLRELFDEISPITDFTGKNLELWFLDYAFGKPRYDEFQCRERDLTYAAPLRVNVWLDIIISRTDFDIPTDGKTSLMIRSPRDCYLTANITFMKSGEGPILLEVYDEEDVLRVVSEIKPTHNSRGTFERELNLSWNAVAGQNYRVELVAVNRAIGTLSVVERKESELFLGDFPIMTENGTFIYNGAERVVVSQLIRSPGVYFKEEQDPASGRSLFSAKLIPNRGAWLEFETNKRDVVSVKVDRKRKLPVTILLRSILAWIRDPDTDEWRWVSDDKLDHRGLDDQVAELFQQVDTVGDHPYIRSTLDKDPSHHSRDALMELYKRLRPGDPPTLENARSLIESLLFNPRRYDLAKVGRYKLNKNLWERNEASRLQIWSSCFFHATLCTSIVTQRYFQDCRATYPSQ